MDSDDYFLITSNKNNNNIGDIAKTIPKNISIMEENVVSTPVAEATESSVKAIINRCLTENGQMSKNVVVKNVTITDCDNYTRVALTLRSVVPGYKASTDENGVSVYEEGGVNTIFTSLFGLAAMLKEDENLAWCANGIIEHPNVLNMILCGASVDILSLKFAEGEPIVNPFSSRDASEAEPASHDTIVHHITGVKLNKVGERMLDKFADKLMDF